MNRVAHRSIARNNKRKRKNVKRSLPKRFWKYAVANIKESSLTEIGAIIESKSIDRKMLKSVILVCCVVGFLYQTYDFIQIYYQYDTVSGENKMDHFDKPAITICDKNLIRRLHFCETDPHLCMDSGLDYDHFCPYFQSYCNELTAERIDQMPKDYIVQYQDHHFYMNYTKASGFSLEDNLVSCSWTYRSSITNKLETAGCGKPKFLRGMNDKQLPGACYSMESAIGKSDYVAEPLSYASIKMTLKWNISDFNNILPDWNEDFESPGAYFISLHNPAMLSNPFVEGFEVLGRKKYRISIYQVEHRRLPPPYSTHCFDYLKAWKENGGRGPLTRQDCEAKCTIDGHFGKNGCAPRSITYPHEMPLCIYNISTDQSLTMNIQECVEKCRDACYEAKYVGKSEDVGQFAKVIDWIDADNTYERFGTFHVTSVEIYFQATKSVETVYTAKYEPQELFGYFGGYIGIWLGWSLAAIFDFFEIIFSILRFLCTNIKEQGRKIMARRRALIKKSSAATALFEKSAVTGVKEIVTAKGLRKKLVKTLIIATSFVGFIYQTYGFLQLYWQYSAVSLVSPLDNINMPAITICDKNLIRRKYFCEVYRPLSCKDQKKDGPFFCINLPEYCVDKNDIYYMVPNMTSFTEDDMYDVNFTKVYGFLLEKSIISCEWIFTNSAIRKSDEFVTANCSQLKFVRGIDEDRSPGACYSLESAIGESDFKAKSFDYAALTMILKWRTADLYKYKNRFFNYNPVTAPRVFYVSVHNPMQLTNPFFDGFQIQEGIEYQINIFQVDQVRLPPPYSTKCFDYMTVWKENGGTGPVTREDCEAECEIQATFEYFTCVTRDVNYPHNLRMCAERPSYDIDLFLKIEDCASKCRDACQETKYEVEIDIIRQVAKSENIEKYGTPNIVSMELQFDVTKSTKTVYSPKYEEDQLYSSIGGLMGMWLGWSFLAIFDLLEITAWTLKPLFRDKQSKARK